MHDTNHSYCHAKHKKYYFLMVVEKSNYFTGIDSSLVANYTDVIDSHRKDNFHEKSSITWNVAKKGQVTGTAITL